MLCCVSHLFIDKEVYVTPENRVTEGAPCILIVIPHFVHVGGLIILHFAFLQNNYQRKGLTKSLKNL